ncbi:MAG: DNA polymerase II [Candidatus Woesearchaeota archaeon]
MTNKKAYRGFVIQPTYKIKDDDAFVYLFGRLESGESFVAINKYKPYFFIRNKEMKKAGEALADIDITGKPLFKKTDMVNFSGEKMSKVILQIPKDIPHVRKRLEGEGIRCYEADIRFEYRFMMDHDIKGTMEIKGEPIDMRKKAPEIPEHIKEDDLRCDLVFLEPEYSESWFRPRLSLLSFDIETDRYGKSIFSIAAIFLDHEGNMTRENMIVSEKDVKNARSFKDESEMVKHFSRLIREKDPDIITGWNMIDFDVKVIHDLLKEKKEKIDWGRASWKNRITFSGEFMKDSKADIPGRMVLDGIALLKNNFIRLTDYKLDTAASEILNDKKLINNVETKGEEIEKLYDEQPEKLIEYNAKDSELVIDILNSKKIIELSIRRSMLTGMPLDRIQASVATLDSLYIRAARKKNIVCSSLSDNEKDAPGKGGYVMEPKAGIYNNVIVLDFKSLYPSIMITFNIDPISLTDKKVKDRGNAIEAPNGAYFKNEEGILPSIIREQMKHREEAKKEKDDIASYAIKIIMNSFYGALGNPGCRFFSMSISNAITHFGQYIIQNTAKEINKKGYEVLYSDTDSVFVDTKSSSVEESHKKGERLEQEMNEYYDGWVKEHYRRESSLYLEYEKNYRKIIFPRQRGEENKGAKKRYAGLLVKDGNEKMDFTGLEFVRRDWTELSKKFQLELLDRIFHEKPVIDYVKRFLKNIRKGKYDDLMIYVKGLRKDLSSYTKTTPPHVKAARKLDKVDSNVIKYYITIEGPEPIQRWEHPLDYDHYIDKQIRPIADSVLCFYNTNLDNLSKGSKQSELFDY